MRFFLDTANVEDIRSAFELGVITGVTTNPSIISKEGKPFTTVLKEISQIVGDSYIFCEVVSMEADGMVKEAKELQSVHSNLIIKIPMCAEGLKAVSRLKKEGIRTCVTLIFSSCQALLAANAGASFVAPFVGRVDDIGWDGCELVAEIAEIFAVQDMKTEIVVASTRHPMHIANIARAGADIATVPYKVIKQMIEHPLTKNGLDKFMEDWEKVPKN